MSWTDDATTKHDDQDAQDLTASYLHDAYNIDLDDPDDEEQDDDEA